MLRVTVYVHVIRLILGMAKRRKVCVHIHVLIIMKVLMNLAWKQYDVKAHKNITLLLASTFIVDNVNHVQCNFLCCPT